MSTSHNPIKRLRAYRLRHSIMVYINEVSKMLYFPPQSNYKCRQMIEVLPKRPNYAAKKWLVVLHFTHKNTHYSLGYLPYIAITFGYTFIWLLLKIWCNCEVKYITSLFYILISFLSVNIEVCMRKSGWQWHKYDLNRIFPQIDRHL